MSIYVDINNDAETAIPRTNELRAAIFTTSFVTAVWFLAVVMSAHKGWLAAIFQPIIGLIVVATIVLPFAVYKTSSQFRNLANAIGHRRIVMFHIWRIPAAFAFFWYGFNGMLPPTFWILAGVGDLLVGIYALKLTFGSQSAATYAKFHRFGFADFVVAVGAGLTYTLLMDVRMAPIAALPLALIPLFGVGISGASHLIAFDMLKRGAGFGRGSARSPNEPQQSRWSALSIYWTALANDVDSSPYEIYDRQIESLSKRVRMLEEKMS